MKPVGNQAAYVLVDDDEDDRYLMRLAIQRLGRELPLHEFVNGKELLDYMTEDTNEKGAHGVYWLIVLDINMPILDGRETLIRLRENPRWRDVPVLMLSTSDDPRQIAELLQAGANAYYTKPSTFDEYEKLFRTTFDSWLFPKAMD
ncbi:response regulator [Fibrella sp. HMF5335]|uniref:Response regulator n=1 Tax=Fibrella rubiginis TaxID=2817060 RepID=A0A939GIM7_9BACT|nr:response regulator [Fibrella rubiginis]MBO0937127.1 response regulator [Fibrella rubiginis]